ncbi:hypothetical protein F0562_006827 [Nyssa sinensis]|uniref:Phospholipase D alpha 1 n=1 Tax=Nyssa sinensis TaxID=561372 RepID=A0A5J5ASK8_9ASTE|nr:hypothetical protein F0562_006827 [Nyssa sinensis]
MAEISSEPEVWLHGDLDLKIVEARSLPNMDIVSTHLRRFLNFEACCRSSKPPSSAAEDGHKKVDHHPRIITSDPYVTVCVPQVTLARTRVLRNCPHPVWNQHFHIPLAHPVVNLEFRVKDNDLFGAELIGKVLISAEKIATGELIHGWFPEHRGVRHTYFPLRKGSVVTLYQDAHIKPDDERPAIELDGGKVYERNTCWEDICHAISEAHHLIYIAGWSVYHKVRLIREPTRPLPRGGNLTLGELLKYKSQEGVRVLLLIWDDNTSHDKFFINTAGVMQTHDEETKKFFKNSSVICALSPRYGSSKLSYIKQKVVGSLFTHHQKCVLVDSQAYGNNRKITAFLGGLDLCDGRYDTPEHRLFRDLDTVFQDDYHNPTFPAGTKAPRQPWHDLHSKIEGPAAYDALINFEQRRISWILSPGKFDSKDGNFSPGQTDSKDGKFSLGKTDSKERKYTIVPEDDPKLWVSEEYDPENWHVQIFRSIDTGSVKGFPKIIDVAEAQNLVCSKNVLVDQSIQTAYIQAIRSAQHFIYIENQYFLGSSYMWPSYKDAGADNLVPMELALKITSKIRAKERFAVYILIPMWPEGDPTSAAVQEILFWQSQTMQMMYTVVARELKAMQLVDSHPQDYLNFYCIGKREEIPKESTSDGSQSSAIVDKIPRSFSGL